MRSLRAGFKKANVKLLSALLTNSITNNFYFHYSNICLWDVNTKDFYLPIISCQLYILNPRKEEDRKTLEWEGDLGEILKTHQRMCLQKSNRSPNGRIQPCMSQAVQRSCWGWEFGGFLLACRRCALVKDLSTSKGATRRGWQTLKHQGHEEETDWIFLRPWCYKSLKPQL